MADAARGFWWRLALASLLPLTTAQAESRDDYSITRAGNRYVGESGDFYRDKVQPILATRCVTCHACNSAPCQLNMTSYEGLVRGMSKENPHGSGLSRVFHDATSARLEDRLTESQWRDRGFYPVLPQNILEAQESVLYLALQGDDEAFGRAEPGEARRALSLLIEEKFECPIDRDEFEDFRADYPAARMPLGCGDLPADEKKALEQWIRRGAPGPEAQGKQILTQPTVTAATRGGASHVHKLIADFETFLNPASSRRFAVARYLFEHMYAMNLYFADSPGEFYRIVRSRTRAPEPIDLIVTEFVTDDPEENVYFRLEKVDRVVELKRHIPFEIGPAFLDEIERTFFDEKLKNDWGYVWLARTYPNNPFDWFQMIPAMARGRFVEKYAKKMMQVVARGAICHGNTPSYVSPDYAWFLIMKPESDPTVMIPALGRKNSKGRPDYKEFYAHPRDTMRSLVYPPNYPWRARAYNQDYLEAVDRLHPQGIGLDDISDVDLFFSIRHESSLEFFSARDVSIPGYTEYKVLWSYADYENFYYRTSVHYKYYGSAAHKFDAFYGVIQRRSLGEYLYSLLNPNYEQRQQMLRWFTTDKGRRFYQVDDNLWVHDHPERGSKEKAQPFSLLSQRLLAKYARFQDKPGMTHFHPSLRTDLDVEARTVVRDARDFEASLRTLTGHRGTFARFFPKVVHVRFAGGELYSLFAHRGHHNDKIVASESSSFAPEYDQLSVAKGLVGAFPYMFFDVKPGNAPEFVRRIAGMSSPSDWEALVQRFGIDRHGPEFYPFVDWMHGWIGRNLGDLGGLLDIRYYGQTPTVR